jgi:type IV secretion system protein VirB9
MNPLVLFLLLISITFTSVAQVIPFASHLDSRIRHIAYHPKDVVLIQGVAGIATHIQVEEGEEYITHAFGHSKGWEFASVTNHFFIKPKEDQAQTHLTIITNRRTYYLTLDYSNDLTAKGMYGVVFDYPKIKRKQAKAEIERVRIEQGFNMQRGPMNLRYSMSGDRDLAPTHVWDDGEFTYFTFSIDKDLPGIYRLNRDGSESIVNRHNTGISSDVIVLHGICDRWVLRLGQRALAVYNESRFRDQTPNRNRTASPLVSRHLKEADHAK